MLKDQLPTLANDTVGQVLPSWLDAFVVLLGRGDITAEIRDGGREGWGGLMIKKEIFKVSLILVCTLSLSLPLTFDLLLFSQTLDTIFRSFPRTLPSTLLVNLLPLIVNHLTSLLPFHTLYSLSSNSDVSPPASTESDGEEITIEQVVCPIIDFLTEITRAGRLVKGWTEGKDGLVESMALGEVVGAVLGFTMMTVEEVSVSRRVSSLSRKLTSRHRQSVHHRKRTFPTIRTPSFSRKTTKQISTLFESPVTTSSRFVRLLSLLFSSFSPS